MEMTEPPVMTPPKKSGMPGWAWGLIGCAVILPCIAIFAAVLFPVFSQARLAAKRTLSMTNLKQIGISAMMYSVDHNDRFPIAKGWETSLTPFISDPKVFTDPNAPAGFQNKRGYAMNQAAGSVKTTSIPSPNMSPLFFTATVDEVSAVGGADILRFDDAKRAILCAADGSARQIRPEAVSTLVWDLGKAK
jgi:hypothetical protein